MNTADLIERRLTFGVAGTASPAVRADIDAGRIVGYGAVFYDGSPATEYQLYEDLVERILPGAFDRAIRERDDVRGLFNHDASLVLGRTASGTMTLRSDARGLLYSIEPAETSIGRDVREHLARGDVTGSSFAFIPTEEFFRKLDGEMWVREVVSVQLFDVGPVTFPAYTATTAGVRQDGSAGSSIDLAGRLAGLRVRAQACELLAGVRR